MQSKDKRAIRAVFEVHQSVSVVNCFAISPLTSAGCHQLWAALCISAYGFHVHRVVPCIRRDEDNTKVVQKVSKMWVWYCTYLIMCVGVVLYTVLCGCGTVRTSSCVWVWYCTLYCVGVVLYVPHHVCGCGTVHCIVWVWYCMYLIMCVGAVLYLVECWHGHTSHIVVSCITRLLSSHPVALEVYQTCIQIELAQVHLACMMFTTVCITGVR